ncbi:MAG TPA: protein-L-isoaspartate(D-aspartate) O-methyltransferase [Polyangia bacterium]|jgi:protein-L-isoaspartate(D-aspartate) O-methyltransferase
MNFDDARRRMVDEQLAARGITDARVLAAMGRVPRHRFVAERLKDEAYGDHPLPLVHGQTLSQPYMVARMSELCELTGTERVLEIGAGSGYQTAVLCELCAQVYAVEIVRELCEAARARLTALGYHDFALEGFDGSNGWPEHAPYDAILVAAGAPAVPPLLLYQLADHGRLVVPVGTRGDQRLQCIRRKGDQFDTLWDTPCRFVDLVGRYGWGGEGPAQA